MQTPDHGVVMAPVSPAVAALLHQLQAQIIKEADESRTPEPTGLALLPSGHLTARYYTVNGKQALEFEDAQYNGLTLYRTHTPDGLSESLRADWHPSHWSGIERLRDQQGRRWNSSVGVHVTDDFGFLVPVDRQ